MVTVTQFGGVVMPAINTQDAQTAIAQLEETLSGADPGRQAAIYLQIAERAFAIGLVRTKALPAAEEALQRAIALDDARLRVRALNFLSTIHDHMGTRHESLRLAQEAEQRAGAAGDQVGLAYALNNQAQFYKETGNNPRANVLFNRVLAIAEALDDPALLLRGLVGMGRSTCMAEPDRGMDYYRQAIAQAELSGDTFALGVCYCNLADWKIFTGDYESADGLYERSAAYAAAAGDKGGVARALTGKARVHSLRQEHADAWAYLKTALPLLLSTADIEGELRAYLNIAHLYVVEGDISRACDYYQRALDKSILAPDSSCAIFAQQALDQVANGHLPKPGIMPMEPITAKLLLLKEVHDVLSYTYPTNDRKIGGG